MNILTHLAASHFNCIFSCSKNAARIAISSSLALLVSRDLFAAFINRTIRSILFPYFAYKWKFFLYTSLFFLRLSWKLRGWCSSNEASSLSSTWPEDEGLLPFVEASCLSMTSRNRTYSWMDSSGLWNKGYCWIVPRSWPTWDTKLTLVAVAFEWVLEVATIPKATKAGRWCLCCCRSVGPCLMKTHHIRWSIVVARPFRIWPIRKLVPNEIFINSKEV